MLYDGFIVLDTRESSYGENIPGVSGGEQGGSMPSGREGGGGGGWASWITPETIGATLGLVTTGVEAAKKTEDQKAIKAVCGPRPLFNKEKKKTYQACVERYMAAQQQPVYTPPPPGSTGMSTGTKILIAVLVLMVLAMMIFLMVRASKAKAA